MNNTKKSYILDLFDSIANNYDKMNQIMTLGMNDFIKKQAIRRSIVQKDFKILDLCCGTGDIAIALAKKYPSAKITAIDFSQNMLDIAKKRAKGISNIEFIQGDALNLPFDDSYFDACFISFGLRNLTCIESGLEEMKRVTKNSGTVTNLDLGKPNKLFNVIFRPYFFYLVPFLAKVIHGDVDPYKYLPESGDRFPSQKSLVKTLEGLGFTEIENYNYCFGAIAQQIAKVRK